MMQHPILIFDGECNFCRACVRWLVEHDPEGRLHYASLESDVGRSLLRAHGVDPDQKMSVSLIEDDVLYSKSEAVLRAIQMCQSRWRAVRASRIIPRRVRDFGYDLVSDNRPFISRMLGTIHHRWNPPPEVADRFLSD